MEIDNLVPEVSPNHRRRGPRNETCLVWDCDEKFSYAKPHAFSRHLPDLFREGLDPESVTVARLRALEMVAGFLLGRPGTISELARWVGAGGFQQLSTRGVGPLQEHAARVMCREAGLEIPNRFTLWPLSTPALLVHWRALVIVCSFLSDQQRAVDCP